MLGRQRDAYLDFLAVERGLAENTVAAYRGDLDRYIEFLGKQGRTTVADVTRDDVTEFGHVIGTGMDGGSALAPSSANRSVAAIRGWHRFALAEGWTASDPSHDTALRRIPRRLPKAVSIGDISAILEVSGLGGDPIALRDRALLELLYASGARISETVGLDIDELTLTSGQESVLLKGKGRKERVVPIGSAARIALEAYLAVRGSLVTEGRGTPALFLNTRGNRLSRQSAWAVLKTAAKRAGVDGVSPHSLRHSFATHLLSGGADVRVVQELLGHASVTTTQIYTQVTQDSLRDVYTTSHPRALG